MYSSVVLILWQHTSLADNAVLASCSFHFSPEGDEEPEMLDIEEKAKLYLDKMKDLFIGMY